MRKLLRNARNLASCESTREGNILVLSTGAMIMVLAFAAFSVDVGYIALTKTQLQAAVDAAALAAAMELNPVANQDDVEEWVKDAAVEVAALNRAGDHEEVFLDPDTDIDLGRRTFDAQTGEFTMEFGPDAQPYNIVRVTARRTQSTSESGGEGGEEGTSSVEDNRLPLFFAPVIGHEKVGLQTSAVATFQPRDVMLVLDYSASMNDDSEFKSITAGNQSQDAVESNIEQIWEDLGSPAYGNLPFHPEYVTSAGQPEDPDNNIPHIDVTWTGRSVDVVSTLSLTQVKLEFTDGYTQTFSSPSGTTGSFEGTGANNNKWVESVWVLAGDNALSSSAGIGERFDFDIDGIVSAFGLDNVTYPGTDGSWEEFIAYVKNHSSSMGIYDYDVYAIGYRRKFGIMCLINYWNKHYPMSSQTPALWEGSQQPITALKNSTDIFLDYLTDVEAEDKVGLAVYSYPQGGGAKLESGLTTDFDSLKTISRERQAGHYDRYTNIGAGIRDARIELVDNARPNAFRMIVLMTDGIANRSSTSASPAQFALDEADLAAEAKIEIVTISLGMNADTWLMQEIADRTGGIHFNVPGGVPVSQYETELHEVYSEIAADRPLKLLRDTSDQ